MAVIKVPRCLEFLAGERRWVGWRWQSRDDRTTKPPIRVHGGRPGMLASCNDPATWAYLTEAQAAWASGRLAGIGLQLLNLKGFAAIDLDDVRDASTGELRSWAQRLVADCASYAEVTPSGTGVRILGAVTADFPPNHRKFAHPDGGSFEIYANTTTGRFITVTGDRLADCPDLLAPIDLQLGRLLAAARTATSTAPGAARPPAVTGLSANLLRLIETGSTADRSADFQSAVSGLLRAGFNQAEALAIFRAHPNGPAGKYVGRLETELDRSWSKAQRYTGSIHGPTNRPETTCTEDMVATVLADRFGDDLRFDHDARCWFVWRGDHHWQRDDEDRVRHHCRGIARELASAAEPSRRSNAGRASFVAGAERLAQADPSLAARRAEWDPDPFLLGVPGGVVDLRTGDLGPPDRTDRISRCTRVAPADSATCDHWLAFIDQVTGGDADLRGYLQRLAGYCLTGSTVQQTLTIIHGPAACGTSTYVSTLLWVLGDYALGTSHVEARHRNDRPIAVPALEGRRLVHADALGSLSGTEIRQLTASDPIAVDSPRSENFSFRPQFKVMATAELLPTLRNVDPALRRRLQVVPFRGQPAETDPGLGQSLQAEAPAILAWAIRGCLTWQARGLSPPAVVIEASSELASSQDLTGRWLSEQCVTAERAPAWTPIADLYGSWSRFCRSEGQDPGSIKAFALDLGRRGFAGHRRRVDGWLSRGRTGIGLRHTGGRPRTTAVTDDDGM